MSEYINEIEESSRRLLLEGIVQGKPIAGIVNDVMDDATAYGARVAETREYWPAISNCADHDALIREGVAIIIDALFTNRHGLNMAIRHMVLTGTAFGFEQAKAKQGIPA